MFNAGDDLSPISSLKQLKEVGLRGLLLQDSWLRELNGWPALKRLDLRLTDVTNDGVKQFVNRRNNVDTYVTPNLFGEITEIKTLLELGPLRGSVEVDG